MSLLHYQTAGERTNPPLLLLHGFLGSHQDFEPLLPMLSTRFYCILPDLPGHGQTLSIPGDYTFSATAIALLTLLDHLKISQTHLLGYSLGGRLALYLVCHYPERFMNVILESASPGLKTAEERKIRIERDEAIAQQLETLPLAGFLLQWYSNPLFASLQARPDLYAAMLRQRQNNHPMALAKALRGFSLGRQNALWHCLPEIERSLLLVGALDSKFVAINRDMVAQCKSASLTILEGCGHNTHLENPELYALTVARFINEHSEVPA